MTPAAMDAATILSGGADVMTKLGRHRQSRGQVMSPAEIARAMGEYIRKHGFSPEYCTVSGAGCFIRAYDEIRESDYRVASKVLEIAGATFVTTEILKNAGWTEGCTDDAAAACDIAADLLTP